MASYPPGHRREDYKVKLLDHTLAWLGDLETVHKLKGAQTLYGQYGANLTFSLNWDDPWTSVLNESKLHFVAVYRDGTLIFSGMQAKKKIEDTITREDKYIEFEFQPLSRLLYYRYGKPTAGSSLAFTAKVDDAFKDIVTATCTGTAPDTPTTALGRDYLNFTVAGDKTEHGDTVTLDATGRNIYEFLQARGYAYTVDWDVYFDGSFNPTYETWYPRRGDDRTEDNGVNTECIITDAQGSITQQNYGQATADYVNVVLDQDMGADVAGAAGDRTNWWLREVVLAASVTEELDAHLELSGIKEFYELQEFREREACAWGTHFFIGDTVTWNSLRLSYGPHNDIICRIDFELDEAGFEHLKLTFGDPEPNLMDKLRRGKPGPKDIGWPAHECWYLRGDTPSLVPRVYPGNYVTIEGTAGKVTVTEGTNKLTIDSVAGGETPKAHDILSAQHGDTAADAVTRGSIIYGNATPKWDELVIGAADRYLKSDGTDAAWGQVDHDTTVNFVANEHIDHSGVSITAGAGLTGGGDLTVTRTIDVGAGTGIGVNANDVQLSHLGIEALSDPGADRIMFWDDGEGACKWLTANTGLTISGTNLNASTLAHTHDLAYTSTNSGNTQPTLGGITDTWTTQGAADPDGIDVHDSGGTAHEMIHFTAGVAWTYVYMDDVGDGSNATWVACTCQNAYINSVDHTHALTNASGKGYFSGTVSNHLHTYDKTNTPTGAVT